MKRPLLITILICLYCVLNASDLIGTWMYSPHGLMGAAALALWASPVMVFWHSQWRNPLEWNDRPFLLGLALLFSVNGTLGSLHVLGHIGLVCALGSLLPPFSLHPVWLVASLSWMPALDWFGGRFFPESVAVFRIVLAALPAWLLIRSIQHQPRSNP